VRVEEEKVPAVTLSEDSDESDPQAGGHGGCEPPRSDEQIDVAAASIVPLRQRTEQAPGDARPIEGSGCELIRDTRCNAEKISSPVGGAGSLTRREIQRFSISRLWRT
jgi:hypothetical protein